MERVGVFGRGAVVALFAALHLHLHLHFHHFFHHKFHGPPFDYATLAAAVAASWAGLPGPGEPVLFAAGVLAANHHLDIASVLAVAFATAVAGGVAGWLVGLKAGRTLLERPGPLRNLRLRVLERGDEVFKRYVAIAIFLAPSFVSGIYNVRPRVYMVWNTFWALVWTLGIGLGAYFAGPPIVDVIVDLGWISIVGLVLLATAGVVIELRRRRTRRTHGAASS